jgi:hypothetical protein
MTEDQVRTGNAILNGIQDRKNLKHSAKKIFTSGLLPYVSTDGTTEKIYLSPAIANKLYSMLEAGYDHDIQKYEEELKSL